ncbi:MAG: lipocalin-like domain-containing protein [Proteobacteria bacterium]|nr:lipocalin-like domain-containing protein [Pseudomonadota bacterium]MDA1059390.1 lipocalin-like domain-containing protein [Pseudomonadota bacterium]
MIAEAIVGTWALVSVERRFSDGRVTQPMGDAPVGRLTYTADGYMQAILMPGGRQAFESGDVYGTPEERMRGAAQFVSYAGRYEWRDGTLYHHPEASFFPNWVGKELRRKIELTGNRMTLSTDPEIAGGGESAGVLVWEKQT